MGTVVRLKVKDKKRLLKEEWQQIYLEIIDRLVAFDLKSVADSSGVSYTTLYNWLYRDVENPQLRTLYLVAESIGLKIELVQVRDKQVSNTAAKRKTEAA